MNNSPDGQSHPGEIVHIDHIDNRTWTVPAAQVPQVVAWQMDANGQWAAVVKVEILGTEGKRTIISYGANGDVLQTLVQAP